MTAHAEADVKHLAYSLLVNSGITQEKAAHLLGYSPKSISKLNKAVAKKEQFRDLTDSRYVRPATRALLKLLKGKRVGEMDEIRGSDVVAAIRMVADRFQPVRSSDGPAEINLTQINLHAYSTAPEAPPPGGQTVEMPPISCVSPPVLSPSED